ncbi:MAG: zinc ribbon domain-containing protein [Candidatus Saccharicenans sp.]
MGIKRCPYCRALISDEDQYCKNCGTQLLFPEDEDLEEEIPGDKIIEDDQNKSEHMSTKKEETHEILEEKDIEEKEDFTQSGEEEIEEISEEDDILAEDEQEEKVMLVEEEMPEPESEIQDIATKSKNNKAALEETGFSIEEVLPFPEEKLEGKREEFLGAGRNERGKKANHLAEFQTEKLKNKKPGLVTQIVDELKAEEIKSEKEAKAKEKEEKPGLVTQLVQELVSESEGAKEETSEMPNKEIRVTPGNQASDSEETIPMTFKTEELDQIGPTVEVGKRQVEDFLKILEEKEKERIEEKLSQLAKDEDKTGAPSWLKEAPTAELKSGSTELIKMMEEADEEEKLETSDIETSDEWEEEISSRPTMGFPEKVTRSQLELEKEEEFMGEESLKTEEITEEEAIEEETSGKYELTEDKDTPPMADTVSQGETEGVEKTLPPLGFKNFIKAKIFDLLFIIMFWLLSTWLVAKSMEATIFKLLDVASSSLLIFLVILTSVYFFLFYFFLGETLGDRLFREEEEEENSEG